MMLLFHRFNMVHYNPSAFLTVTQNFFFQEVDFLWKTAGETVWVVYTSAREFPGV